MFSEFLWIESVGLTWTVDRLIWSLHKSWTDLASTVQVEFKPLNPLNRAKPFILKFNCSEIAMHHWINTHRNPESCEAQLLYGHEIHTALQAASHFAFRFFEASVEWLGQHWWSMSWCAWQQGTEGTKSHDHPWPVSCCDCAKVGKWFCPRASQQDDQGVELMWICWRCNRKTPGIFASETSQREGWWVVD